MVEMAMTGAMTAAVMDVEVMVKVVIVGGYLAVDLATADLTAVEMEAAVMAVVSAVTPLVVMAGGWEAVGTVVV